MKIQITNVSRVVYERLKQLLDEYVYDKSYNALPRIDIEIKGIGFIPNTSYKLVHNNNIYSILTDSSGEFKYMLRLYYEEPNQIYVTDIVGNILTETLTVETYNFHSLVYVLSEVVRNNLIDILQTQQNVFLDSVKGDSISNFKSDVDLYYPQNYINKIPYDLNYTDYTTDEIKKILRFMYNGFVLMTIMDLEEIFQKILDDINLELKVYPQPLNTFLISTEYIHADPLDNSKLIVEEIPFWYFDTPGLLEYTEITFSSDGIYYVYLDGTRSGYKFTVSYTNTIPFMLNQLVNEVGVTNIFTDDEGLVTGIKGNRYLYTQRNIYEQVLSLTPNPATYYSDFEKKRANLVVLNSVDSTLNSLDLQYYSLYWPIVIGIVKVEGGVITDIIRTYNEPNHVRPYYDIGVYEIYIVTEKEDLTNLIHYFDFETYRNKLYDFTPQQTIEIDMSYKWTDGYNGKAVIFEEEKQLVSGLDLSSNDYSFVFSLFVTNPDVTNLQNQIKISDDIYFDINNQGLNLHIGTYLYSYDFGRHFFGISLQNSGSFILFHNGTYISDSYTVTDTDLELRVYKSIGYMSSIRIYQKFINDYTGLYRMDVFFVDCKKILDTIIPENLNVPIITTSGENLDVEEDSVFWLQTFPGYRRR